MGVGSVYALQGRRKEAEQILVDALKRGPTGALQAGIAMLYLDLGDKENALAHLKQAVENREALALGDPRWDPIANDPRFRELEARVGK